MTNVKAFPDLTGYAPAAEAWHAYDVDTYDGAPDAGPQIVGVGPTAEAAIADCVEQSGRWPVPIRVLCIPNVRVRG